MVQVKGFQGITTLDYPDKVSSTIFLAGCNFRCPFCHNKELVDDFDSLQTITEERLFSLIDERKNFIEGISITGGEPLLSEDIIGFISNLREKFKLPVKVDTNGYNPQILKKLLSENLIDYVAMDIKTSPSKYVVACGVNIDFERIKSSVEILLNSKIDYEFRTTIVPQLVTLEDVREIGVLITGAKKYVIQQFRNWKTLNDDFTGVVPYKPEELKKFRDIMTQFVPDVSIVGI
ncbi:MAG: anaerobic ribonucleoside-triphosphate reductase activating protein [bacterium]|uniref:Anaerobic ribonucleoside-triphosphate reductase activating protein n=2 Tax=Bacteria candidate phyla TaxID=1783234 RepID=A0A101I4D6_UNCT6|nr:MAG: Anaerobic ribonucleoside-triphosphate reductase activating protein [candidate division TA06 bacterium 32_111]KUK87705.1 MAG: Anaerobic ribonucleoside-triphosphate reductase activating protein [candidate division TA06 bacterium 34_109]MDI6699836.1 anaerobic ribonucleoside-triphosphate reductase activating protein [bacterium]HAF07543.1 anaerobic ribonucleoside-triphosphate reductase activating protein [candidate division WOR-3 bacterium]HCP17612.1 anaerobic ribonucleoside-triphosphate red